MKRMIAIFLVLMVMSSVLSACLSVEEQTDDNTNTTGHTDIPPRETSEAEDGKAPTEIYTNSTEPTVGNHYVRLIDARPFSDGVAWVKYVDYVGDGKTERVGIMNTDGQIFRLNLDEPIHYLESGSDFSEGYSYINYGGHFVIINNLGEITARSPEGGTYEVLAGGDGVYLVCQEVRSFSENKDLYGCIDAHGNWIVEPTADHQFSYIKDVLGNMSAPVFRYLGEHIFYSASKNGWTQTYYNADSNKYYHCDPDDQGEYVGAFCDGYAINGAEDTVYLISRDFEITELFEWSSYNDVMYSSGGVVFHEYTKYGAGSRKTYSAKFFLVKNGEMMCNLSEYSLQYTGVWGNLYRFENGAAAVCVMGADKKDYIVLIDTHGNFLMDPIKVNTINGGFEVPKGEPFGTYSDGKIFVRSENGCYVLCADGTIIETKCDFLGMDKDEIVFKDGFAWYEMRSSFVDAQGNRLFSYIYE